MVTSGDVTVTQDGGQGNVKLHPYLVTLVRWCVSCLWSTATVFVHRLVTTPLQPITGPKPAPTRAKVPRRAAGTDHLHPEPRVECQLLHRPDTHTMDVIFVHGLYGSLGNTWRQGEWHHKYVSYPKLVTLRDHSKLNRCNCHENSYKNHIHNENKCDDAKAKQNSTNHIRNKNKYNDCNVTDLNDPEMSFENINKKLSKKVIPDENDLITEQFYNNTLVDQDINLENYDLQAKFVRDMFKKETDCDKSYENSTFKYNDEDDRLKRDTNSDNGIKYIYNDSDASEYDDNGFKCDLNDSKSDDENSERDNDLKCNYNAINDFNECKCSSEEKNCEIGCGCICNDCYSSCWPRDWIKVDFPGARVISINYTSDPYLWRPLWIKENKRLNLYQRAEQMSKQLIDMGVGDKPIIWVGHSKGGLFIKQIYCEAYEAYMKTNKNLRTDDKSKQVYSEQNETISEHNGITAENIDTIIGHFSQKEETENKNMRENYGYTKDNYSYTKGNKMYLNKSDYLTNENNNYTNENDSYKNENNNYINENDSYTKENNHTKEIRKDTIESDYTTENTNYFRRTKDNKTNACVINETIEYENVFEQDAKNNNDALQYNKNNANAEYVDVINDNIRNLRIENGNEANRNKLNADSENRDPTSRIEELVRRASLWSASRGFMFYSVPHRGSPLAHIKTPVTARSVDLLEIAKDCPLVLELQARWEHVVGLVGTRGPPAVRSVVETCRTLMSVLWLRIVSTDSADAGIGVLSGIPVDHREICKPTSRSCLLYTSLTDLIHDAISCQCH